MKLSEEKRVTLQALSEYVGLLLELSDDCTASHSILGSKWHWTDKNSPPKKLANELIKQLSYLPSQAARSQILMLSVSNLTTIYAYYMNMVIQLLLQRDVFARQFQMLRQLQDECRLIINHLREFCAKARDNGLSEEVKEAADIEQLESIITKIDIRLKCIQSTLKWFDQKLDFSFKIDFYLDQLSGLSVMASRPKGLFGLIYMPYGIEEEVKVTEPLARALSLHSKYAGDEIDPNWRYPGCDKEWDLALADECQEYQSHIKSTDQLITECSDVPDIAALVKLVTKML